MCKTHSAERWQRVGLPNSVRDDVTIGVGYRERQLSRTGRPVTRLRGAKSAYSRDERLYVRFPAENDMKLIASL